MIVFPAIDIQGGRCVRLKQGEKNKATVYGDDPVAMAQKLADEGAAWLHIVDLDGAFAGTRTSRDCIARIAKTVTIPIEVGGGIRSEEAVADYLESGVRRVIIGSKAVADPDWVETIVQRYGSEAIAVSVDARDGFVATHGWVATSKQRALDVIGAMKHRGVTTFIYTDISRDGMMTGPNIPALTAAHALGGINIIASGGISRVADLEQCRDVGLYGAIMGRALYEGAVTMADIRQLQNEK